MRYSIVPRTKKYVNLYGFLFLGRILSNKYGRQLLDTATKTAKMIALWRKMIYSFPPPVSL